MLADGCEAATRAARPATPEELGRVVNGIFEARFRDGQLEECPLTLRELRIVRETYQDVLRGAFHPRIKYPDAKEK